MDYARRFRERLNQEEIIQCVGAHNPLTANLAEMVGFDAIYMSGGASALALNGYTDERLPSVDRMVSNANRMQERVNTPIIADANDGYGGILNVIDTVREFIKTGVAGVHIEDQVSHNKRGGSFEGKQVIDVAEGISKIQAAADVRDDRDEDFIIIARTDARDAISLDEAIDRANTFCEHGGDMAFVAAMRNREEVERVGRQVEAPVLYESPLSGPRIRPSELNELGFDVVLWPLVSVQAVAINLYKTLERFKADAYEAQLELDDQFRDVPFDSIFDDPGGVSELFEIENYYRSDDLPPMDLQTHESRGMSE